MMNPNLTPSENVHYSNPNVLQALKKDIYQIDFCFQEVIE